MTLEELLKVVPANIDLEVEELGQREQLDNYNGNYVVRGQAIIIMTSQSVLLAKEVAAVYPVPSNNVFTDASKLIIKLKGDVRN